MGYRNFGLLRHLPLNEEKKKIQIEIWATWGFCMEYKKSLQWIIKHVIANKIYSTLLQAKTF